MSRFTLTALATLCFLASCVGPDKIREGIVINDFAGVEEFGSNGRTVLLDVDYRLNKDLSLRDGQFVIRSGKRTFAKIKAEDVTVKKRSSGLVELPMQVTVNSVSTISAVFSKPKIGDMTVSGNIKVKYGGLGKKLKLENVPVTKVLDTLGIEEETFLNLFQ